MFYFRARFLTRGQENPQRQIRPWIFFEIVLGDDKHIDIFKILFLYVKVVSSVL